MVEGNLNKLKDILNIELPEYKMLMPTPRLVAQGLSKGTKDTKQRKPGLPLQQYI